MKRFDEKLSDRIREEFDRYDEPFDQEGWDRLSMRLDQAGRSRKTLLFSRLGQAAAVLLLVASAVYMFVMKPDTDDHLADVPAMAMPMEPLDAALPVAADRSLDIRPATYSVTRDPQQVIAIAKEDVPAADPGPGIAERPVSSMIAMAPALAAPDPVKPPILHIAGHDAHFYGDRDSHSLAMLPGRELDPPAREGVRWNMLVGSHATYAENQLASGLGIGAGVMAEYPLTSSLSLSSGLVLSHSNFSVKEMPVESYIEESDVGHASFVRFDIYGDHTYRHYAADVPLNLKVRLWERPGHALSLQTGVSTLFYFQQHVEGVNTIYAKDYVELPGGMHVNTSTDISHQEFTADDVIVSNHLDPARILNVSFLYETGIQRRGLSIEPYVKLPLGPVSGHQLRFGTGGVNIRYHIFN